MKADPHPEPIDHILAGNPQVEGLRIATLLFLFSFSGGLEQFAHHRTQKTISSLLKAAPSSSC